MIYYKINNSNMSEVIRFNNYTAMFEELSISAIREFESNGKVEYKGFTYIGK